MQAVAFMKTGPGRVITLPGPYIATLNRKIEMMKKDGSDTKDWRQEIKSIPAGSRMTNLTGLEYGRLTVLGYLESVKENHKWVCECTCGTVKPVWGSALKSGAVNSCGCLKTELTRGRWITHGNSRDPLYQTWKGMLHRCYSQDSHGYARYGGRGLTVSDEFLEFEKFKKFVLAELGSRPSKSHSLDRIDNNLGYYPGNLRWATKKQQSNNTSTNIFVTVDGVTLTVSEACDLLGVPRNRVYERIRVHGWDAYEALTTPSRTKHNYSPTQQQTG